MDHPGSNPSYEIDTCPTSSTHTIVVSLSNRHISWFAIATVCLAGSVFLGGYFLGTGHHTYDLDKSSITISDPLHTKKLQNSCYAQLASFGSLATAKLFVQHLQQKKIIAKVVERKNDTVSGKEVIWYQVITGIFDTQDELRNVLSRLEQEEKLNDIRIIVC